MLEGFSSSWKAISHSAVVSNSSPGSPSVFASAFPYPALNSIRWLSNNGVSSGGLRWDRLGTWRWRVFGFRFHSATQINTARLSFTWENDGDTEAFLWISDASRFNLSSPFWPRWKLDPPRGRRLELFLVSPRREEKCLCGFSERKSPFKEKFWSLR